MIHIEIDKELAWNRPSLGQITEGPLKDYIDNLVRASCNRGLRGNKWYADLYNGVDFDIEDMVYILYTLEGTVEGYRAYIKIETSKLDDVTPDYLPNRVVKNWDNTDPENPIELPDTYRTWREWSEFRKNSWSGKISYPITEIEGFAYISTQASGEDLSSDVLLRLYMEDGQTIVDSLPGISAEIP